MGNSSDSISRVHFKDDSAVCFQHCRCFKHNVLRSFKSLGQICFLRFYGNYIDKCCGCSVVVLSFDFDCTVRMNGADGFDV